MIIPQYLKKDSKIALISPAGKIRKEFVNDAVELIKNKAFIPVVFPSCFNEYFQAAGKDGERLADLQNAIDSEEIDAILCSRGGYGVIRILDKLDFTGFIQKPKWLIGFSDITNLHLALNKIGIQSIHAQMAKAMHENPYSKAVTEIFDILRGNLPEYQIEPHPFNRKGTCTGEIIGGNLSIIYSLQSTAFEINTNNKILFIEDLNEYLYHIDRMMINLKLSGKLKNLKGLIVGAFTEIKDNDTPFGKSVYEIISEHVQEYDFPVCYNFPVGHIDNNLPIIEGSTVKLSINENSVNLKFI
ncbi:MAG: LD-carboxypeptidase [Endomicrobiia bacterium]